MLAPIQRCSLDVGSEGELRIGVGRGSLRECGFVDSTRGVTGRSDIWRWDLQKRTNARRTGRTRAMQWGPPRLSAE